jgi:very-short-patch-repair endonuclease
MGTVQQVADSIKILTSINQIARYLRILQLNEHPEYKSIALKYKPELEYFYTSKPNNLLYYLLNGIDDGVVLQNSKPHPDAIQITKTENKLGIYLRNLKLDPLEQYKIDTYSVDYYIKESNLIIEYFGPKHFYPLQTQIDQMSKFRLKYLSRKGYRFIIVPHFFFERYTNDTRVLSYLETLLKKPYDYDLLTGSVFYQENYDMFKLNIL